MPPLLDIKDERACFNIVSGMNQTDAMIAAGYTSKWVSTHTTRWLNKANIRERINELRLPIENELIASRDEILEVKTEIMRNKEAKPRDRLMAGDGIGDFQGYKAAEKHLNLNVTVTSELLEEARRLLLIDKQEEQALIESIKEG